MGAHYIVEGTNSHKFIRYSSLFLTDIMYYYYYCNLWVFYNIILLIG